MPTSADLSQKPARYDGMAMAFHWASFLLIAFVASLGLRFDSMARADQPFWINIHALVGLLVLALALTRIGWRLSHTPPELPAHIDALSRRLSGPTHFLLYGLMIVIPLIGIVAFVWHGRAFEFGVMRIDFGIKSDRTVFHPAEDVHGLLAYGLFALVGLHVLAAFWHQYLRRDGVLSRMLPW